MTLFMRDDRACDHWTRERPALYISQEVETQLNHHKTNLPLAAKISQSLTDAVPPHECVVGGFVLVYVLIFI